MRMLLEFGMIMYLVDHPLLDVTHFGSESVGAPRVRSKSTEASSAQVSLLQRQWTRKMTQDISAGRHPNGLSITF